MIWEPRPVPEVTPETDPFWRGAAEGRFLLCNCADCELVFYYPRALCPDCFSSDVDWLEAEGRGTIYAYSVTKHVSGWPEDALPLVVAYVELSEGVRVLTNIVDCDPEHLEIGTAVDVQFVETKTEGIAIPVFSPV